jgi:hypothetical protein
MTCWANPRPLSTQIIFVGTCLFAAIVYAYFILRNYCPCQNPTEAARYLLEILKTRKKFIHGTPSAMLERVAEGPKRLGQILPDAS